MTLQQLRYFLAAAEHGSFTAAARALYVAQPSLSEQVRQLEAELGVDLFVRAGRGIALTEAGRAFRPEAARVVDGIGRARDAVRDVRELRGGTLSFGMYGTASGFLIADLVGTSASATRTSGCGSSARTRRESPTPCARDGSRRRSSCSRSTTTASSSGRSIARSSSSSAATRSGSPAR